MLSTQQVFWSVAIVSSVLLVILLVLTLFHAEEEFKKGNRDPGPSSFWFDPRLILIFITLFGWLSVIGFYLGLTLRQNILLPVLFAFVATYTPALLRSRRKRPSFELTPDLKGAILSTGQALQPIPPHRNGFGKVQLDHRQRHLEIDAITAGQEIQPGAPVRVVDVIDNRILVVEPLPAEIPPDGGMIRNEGAPASRLDKNERMKE